MNSGRRRKQILAGVTALAAIWFVATRLGIGNSPAEAHAEPRAATAELDTASVITGPDATATPAAQDLRAALDAATWPTDPFHNSCDTDSEPNQADAGDGEVVGEPRFVFSAVISGTPPLALINERIVRPGDRLSDGSVVGAIDAETVTLQTPEGTRVLHLSK